MAEDIVLGAKQFPDPGNIKIKEDTDPPDMKDTPTIKMNTSNPPRMMAEPHLLEQHFGSSKRPGRGYRHPVGGKVPPVTEN
jgi:hypothetical protein